MAGSEVGEAGVLGALTSVIKEMNEERDEDAQLGTDPASILYGSGGELDSLDLVRLVVLFEQQLDEDTGRVISIADDRAMSQESSHFHTVGSLVQHVTKLMKEEAGGG